jgi:hypothetical protein
MAAIEGGALVFCYSYGMGGWGDMLKGLHTCWCWAKATGRELQIDFSRHVFGHVFPQYGVAKTTSTGVALQLIDKVGEIRLEEIAMITNPVVMVTCNWFSPSSVAGVSAEVVLGFYDALYADLFPIAWDTGAFPTTYRVFHCRMGDKYLSEAYACKGDNRIGSMGVLTEQIRAFVGSGGGSTMVCSDHASVIRSLLNQIPNSFSVCTEPYHIAYYREDLLQRIGTIRAMVYEHAMMARSSKIWMAAYSGFPITAAMVGNVPLLLAGEPYRDGYVDFVQGLRRCSLVNTNCG